MIKTNEALTLDTQSKFKTQPALGIVVRNKYILAITHRLSPIESVDIISGIGKVIQSMIRTHPQVSSRVHSKLKKTIYANSGALNA